jgi:hypothetical protein
MQVLITSIIAEESPAARSEALGRYRVTLDAGGKEQVLTYKVELTTQMQSVSWAPADSILSDPRIDVLVVAGVTDTVVAFHHGDKIEFPKVVSPQPAGADTAVIRL